MDDSILKEFIAEAREHLSTIETDLLSIEEAGADLDEDLVNKVFRAAHSIKGASGFFGLAKIKDLAHKAETVLDLIRSRKLVPTAEITNLLLATFDKLREMVNDPGRSDGVDTSALLASLVTLAMEAGSTPSITATGTVLPAISGNILNGREPEPPKEYLYQLDLDLFDDVEAHGTSLQSFFQNLGKIGEILDTQVNFECVGNLDTVQLHHLPVRITLAMASPIQEAKTLVPIPPSKIIILKHPSVAATHAVLSAVMEETPKPSIPVEVIDLPAAPAKKPTPAAAPKSEAAPVSARDTSTTSGPEGTLRVSVGLLESLMNLAGELVLSRNQLRTTLSHSQYKGVQGSFQRINLVTSELQDAIMQTRMQPIGNVFGKFPRVVRDMAHALKKDIQLDIRGKDVGLDKSLIEGLSDPLTHMVRNAADHGLESIEDRIRAGKHASGTIRIEARHEAGQVVVEVADDGRGIDPQRVANAAVAKGLLAAEAVQSMSEKEKMHLIFLPGLSTSEKVTDVSGRGVGMDVVKTNLGRLGGKIEIESELGQGTVFRIKLPLTLAIIPSLVVSVNNERFAIPQISVVELLRIQASKIKDRIEIIGDAEVLVLRDELIPVVRFSDILGVTPTYEDPHLKEMLPDRRTNLADRRSPHRATESSKPIPDPHSEERRNTTDRRYRAQSDLEIVVITIGSMKYGLVVDSFHTGEEIVVKPLGRHLKGLPEYAGATIMGDGNIALIVDAAGLAAKAHLAPVAGKTRVAAEMEAQNTVDGSGDLQSLLLFNNCPEELCAVPLSTVVRVERVAKKQVESIGGRRTMQYRGSFLPLMSLSDVARVGSITDEQELVVIVARVCDREVGLLAAMPVDVLESRSVVDRVTHKQTGIAGSAIIREKTILLADIFELAQTVYPEWNLSREALSVQVGKSNCQVILAEDSDFFRAQVKRILESEGFSVLGAADGEEAWKLLTENPESIQAIITDVEMPRLSGLGLASRVRTDSRFNELPIIALSSLAGEEDIVRGKEAGANEYIVKLDRDLLIQSLRSLLAERGCSVPPPVVVDGESESS
jgi:two-component system chemotaxis sensor kinase CheA